LLVHIQPMGKFHRILQQADLAHHLPKWLENALQRNNRICQYRHHISTLQRFHRNPRFFTSQNNITKTTPSNILKEPKFPQNQTPNILQEKAQNAARLHAELNALLEAQAERQTKELSKPFGSSLKKFFTTNRKEILNIFVAFMCVLLAWQITTMRRGARRLVDISEEKDQVIKELRFILRQLHADDAFVENIVERFVQELKKNGTSADGLPSIEKKGIYQLFHGIFRSNEPLQEDEEKRIRSLLRSVLKQELDRIIGTAAMSDDEIAEKKMADLQKEMGIVSVLDQQSGSIQRDLDQILDSIHGDGDSGDTVKKSKGFI